MDTPQKSHWEQGLALTLGVLLLASFTAYLGAATTVSPSFAQEQEKDEIDAQQQRELDDGKKNFKLNELKWLKESYQNAKRALTNKDPERMPNDLIREAKRAQKDMKRIKKIPNEQEIRAEIQGIIDEATAALQQIGEARKNVKDAFAALEQQYKTLITMKVDAITGLDEFRDLQQQFNDLQRDLNDVVQPVHDASQELNSSDPWNRLNAARAKYELPDRIAKLAKQLQGAQKKVGQGGLKRLKAYYPDFDPGAVLKTLQGQLDEAMRAYEAGDPDEARTLIEELERNNIYDVPNIYNRLGELGSLLSKVQKQLAKPEASEVKGVVDELLGELMTEVNEGSFNNIHQALNELLQPLYDLQRYSQERGNRYNSRLDDLVKRFEGASDKFEKFFEAPPPPEKQPQPMEPKPAEPPQPKPVEVLPDTSTTEPAL